MMKVAASRVTLMFTFAGKAGRVEDPSNAI